MNVTRDLAALDGPTRYKLLTGVIVPRPIAWVTSVDGEGRVNAAPYSFFNAVSATPPVIVLGIVLRPDGGAKDTGANIASKRSFVVNLPDEASAEAMNATSVDAPPEVSEIELAGLELAPMGGIDAPRIASAPVALGCRLRETVDLGLHDGTARGFVVADVLSIHANEGVLDPETLRVNRDVYRPIGRLFGPLYAKLNERFRMDRPSWVKRDEPS